MAKEIERKFLVAADGPWRAGEGRRLKQAYIVAGPEAVVRVRLAGVEAMLAIKGPVSGFTRDEFEIPVPLAVAEEMIAALAHGRIVDKTRYRVPHGNHLWEVDVFHGIHEGLVVAEVELASEDEAVELPDWVGEEVSGDPRFYNVVLAEAAAAGRPVPAMPGTR